MPPLVARHRPERFGYPRDDSGGVPSRAARLAWMSAMVTSSVVGRSNSAKVPRACCQRWRAWSVADVAGEFQHLPVVAGRLAVAASRAVDVAEAGQRVELAGAVAHAAGELEDPVEPDRGRTMPAQAVVEVGEAGQRVDLAGR